MPSHAPCRVVLGLGGNRTRKLRKTARVVEKPLPGGFESRLRSFSSVSKISRKFWHPKFPGNFGSECSKNSRKFWKETAASAQHPKIPGNLGGFPEVTKADTTGRCRRLFDVTRPTARNFREILGAKCFTARVPKIPGNFGSDYTRIGPQKIEPVRTFRFFE